MLKSSLLSNKTLQQSRAPEQFVTVSPVSAALFCLRQHWCDYKIALFYYPLPFSLADGNTTSKTLQKQNETVQPTEPHTVRTNYLHH